MTKPRSRNVMFLLVGLGMLVRCSAPTQQPRETTATAPPAARVPGVPAEVVAAARAAPVPVVAPARPLTTKDSRGQEVRFPHGDLSFADEVISYGAGTPPPRDAPDPNQALGAPDYRSDSTAMVTLGRGGTLVVRFVDNVLVDVAGPDLYVFEVGPDVEKTFVELSEDGHRWIRVGHVDGSTCSLDIAPHIEPGQAFGYVRLTDDRDQGQTEGRLVGADIDAVGAIGSADRITLPGALLFDVDSAELRPRAVAELNRTVGTIRARAGAAVVVEGHTDSTGTREHNQQLSLRRAQAVAAFLAFQGVAANRISTTGIGPDRPVASNDNAAGRQRNRRVEIVIVATKP